MTGAYQIVTDLSNGTLQSSVTVLSSIYVTNITDAPYSCTKEFIYFSDKAEQRRIQRDFQKNLLFPKVLCYIDGSHIASLHRQRKKTSLSEPKMLSFCEHTMNM